MKLTTEEATSVANELMNTASAIRESGEELLMIFAFTIEKDEGLATFVIPAAAIPHDNKDELSQRVRMMADQSGALAVYTVTEAWLGTKLNTPPSEDPDRQEAIMVSASGQGLNLTLTREIKKDGSLGEVQTYSDAQGRMTNLSGREMMN